MRARETWKASARYTHGKRDDEKIDSARAYQHMGSHEIDILNAKI